MLSRLVLVALAAMACGGGGPTPAPTQAPTPTPAPTPAGQTVRGLMLLKGFDHSTGSWSDCAGKGGYDDLAAGGNVRIKNGTGDTIAAGRLMNISEADLPTLVLMDKAPRKPIGLSATDDPGAIAEVRGLLEQSSGLLCWLWWEIKGVPDADIYGIEITHRGTLDYSKFDLESDGWVVSTSIGD